MLSLAFFLLPLAMQAAPPEVPGPHAVGWRDVVFRDAQFGQGTIRARLYYPAQSAGQNTPADPSAGPFPLISFQHGRTATAKMYDNICSHLTSYGFLVASTDTQTSSNPNAQEFAEDTQALLHWVEGQSGSPASWLAGMARSGDWAAVGHSMGGRSLSLLIGIEPRVRTVVALQPGSAQFSGWGGVPAFTGASLWIAGSVDTIVPAATVVAWYNRAALCDRRFGFLVQGMGHLGCTDAPPTNEPLSASEQFRVHQRIVTAFLLAECMGKDEVYEWLAGAGASYGEPWAFLQQCLRPALWGGLTPTALGIEMGVIGQTAEKATLAWSLATGSSSTPLGTAGIDLSQGSLLGNYPLGSDGRGSWSQILDPRFSGRTVYFQAGAWRLIQGQPVGALTGVLPVTIP